MERWKELCERAAKEQDPKRLSELAQEINRLLEQQESEKKAASLRTPTAIVEQAAITQNSDEKPTTQPE
jgi:hypothetical protein